MEQNRDISNEGSGGVRMNLELSPWLKEHLLEGRIRSARIAPAEAHLGERTGRLMRRVTTRHRLASTAPSRIPLSRPFVSTGGLNPLPPSKWGALTLLLSQSGGNYGGHESSRTHPRLEDSPINMRIPEIKANRSAERSSPVRRTEAISSGNPGPQPARGKIIRRKIEEGADNSRALMPPIPNSLPQIEGQRISSPESNQKIIESRIDSSAKPVQRIEKGVSRPNMSLGNPEILRKAIPSTSKPETEDTTRNNQPSLPEESTSPQLHESPKKASPSLVQTKYIPSKENTARPLSSPQHAVEPSALNFVKNTAISQSEKEEIAENSSPVKPGTNDKAIKPSYLLDQNSPDISRKGTQVPEGIAEKAEKVNKPLASQETSTHVARDTDTKETPIQKNTFSSSPKSTDYPAVNLINTEAVSRSEQEEIRKNSSPVEPQNKEKASELSHLSAPSSPVIYRKETPLPSDDNPVDDQSVSRMSSNENSKKDTGINHVSSMSPDKANIFNETKNSTAPKKKPTIDFRPVFKRIFRRHSHGPPAKSTNSDVSSSAQQDGADNTPNGQGSISKMDALESTAHVNNDLKPVQWEEPAQLSLQNEQIEHPPALGSISEEHSQTEVELERRPAPHDTDAPAVLESSGEALSSASDHRDAAPQSGYSISGPPQPGVKPNEENRVLVPDTDSASIFDTGVSHFEPFRRSLSFDPFSTREPEPSSPKANILLDTDPVSSTGQASVGMVPFSNQIQESHSIKSNQPGWVAREFEKPLIPGRRVFRERTDLPVSPSVSRVYRSLDLPGRRLIKPASPLVGSHQSDKNPIIPGLTSPPALDLTLVSPSRTRTESVENRDNQPFKHSSATSQSVNTQYHSIPQPSVTYINRSVESESVSSAPASGQQAENGARDLRTLARDIYPYIKRMIMIEKERLPN